MDGAIRSSGSHGQRLARALFTEADGSLCIGGVPVACLAEQYGTPLFVYDAGVLRQRLHSLRGCLPDGVDVYYSVKANPNPDVIGCFIAEGAGAEVASAAEYLRARAAGCPPERLVFAGPGKVADELALVVRGGIGEMHVESENEIAALVSLARDTGEGIAVSIRVNPAETAAGGAMKMGGRPSVFGFDEEQLDDVVKRVEAADGLHLRGVHMYAGTQILDAGVLVRQWRHAAQLGRRTAAIIGRPVETIDLGGGLGIPYFDFERSLDLVALKSDAEALFAELAVDPAFARAQIIVEPGRYLAGPAGVFVGRVISVKRSRGATFIVLDGGLNHHLAASGNLGQVFKRDYPIVNASRLYAEADSIATVVGPLCTPLDTLGRAVALPETRPGDLVAVLQSGAYALSASPVGFLSHPMPAELLVDDEEVIVIRARGTFEQPVSQLPLTLAGNRVH